MVSGTTEERVHRNLSHFIFPQGVISTDGFEKGGGGERKDLVREREREREREGGGGKCFQKQQQQNGKVNVNKNTDENEITKTKQNKQTTTTKHNRMRIDKSITTQANRHTETKRTGKRTLYLH